MALKETRYEKEKDSKLKFDAISKDILPEEGKDKSTHTYWYPHQNLGNRPDLSNDANTTTNDLENFGAYHFIINFYGAFKPSSSLTKTMDDINKEAEPKIEKMIKEGAGSFLRNSDGTTNLASASVDLVGYTIRGSMFTLETGAEITSKGYDNIVTALPKESEDIVVPAPTLIYDGAKQHSEIHIYLPFKNYVINRSSGIAEQKDVMTNIGAQATKMVYNYIADNIIGMPIKATMNREGSTVRDFVAPRIGSPSLETTELAWELVPRSPEEMDDIINIIRFFQYLSVPNFSKKDFFYSMPPVMQMEAITRNHESGGTVNLRPKKQYYITNININFATGEGGDVLLTPEGYPMFISLKLSLIKADLTTADDLIAYPFM